MKSSLIIFLVSVLSVFANFAHAELPEAGQTLICQGSEADYAILNEGSDRYKINGTDAQISSSNDAGIVLKIQTRSLLRPDTDETVVLNRDGSGSVTLKSESLIQGNHRSSETLHDCAIQTEPMGACENADGSGNHYCTRSDRDSCIQAGGQFYEGESCE